MIPRRLISLAAALSWSCCPLAVMADDERFAAAQVLLHEGDTENALPVFESLHLEAPQNVDYVFAHGIALSRLGRDVEALEVLARGIELAPQYEDIWRTRFNVLARRRDEAALAEFRARAAAQFPLASWWQAPPEQPRYPWTLTLGSGFDSLDNDLPDWNNQFLRLRYEPGDSQSYAIGIARDARNRTSDVSASAAADWSPSHWRFGIALTHSSSPDVMPESGIEVHAGRSFARGWGVSLRHRQRDYASAAVDSTIAGVEKYLGDYRLAYDLSWSRLDHDSSFASHVLTGNWYYSDAASIGLSVSTGREAEAIGGGRVLETDIRAVTLSGRYQFSPRVGGSWWLGVHEQGDLYRRRFVGFAVSIRL